MRTTNKILLKSFVKPFYRENAALFVFVFTMMFFIVNKVDGAELLEYHYSLILATLKSSVILLLVFIVWFVYARKCFVYVSTRLSKPEFTYLHIFNSLSKSKRLRFFFILEVWLLLPILLYAIVIIVTGLRQKYYLPVLFIAVFLLLITIAASVWHTEQLNRPYQPTTFQWQKTASWKRASSYPYLLMAFIVNQQKLLWLGLKVFTCCILYLISRNNTEENYDVKTVYLFYSFGILAHAILIQRIRAFEEDRLSFYRGLPQTTGKRFLQYAIVYAFLLLPELLTITFLVPVHLHYEDALSFLLSSYCWLLLINSLTFALPSSMKEFLKVLLLLFFVQFFFMMAFGLFYLAVLFFASSVIIFYRTYFSFERIH